MRATVAVFAGLAAGFLSFDVIWAVMREQMRWTTVNGMLSAMDMRLDVPGFAQLVFSAPTVLLFAVPAAIFYLLIVWTDFT